MSFTDRYDGGRKLVPLLQKYAKDPNGIVLGLPRGGVVTAYEVAKGLQLPLDIICPRKIGAPFNPEYAIGAITETGEKILNEDVIDQLGISEEYIEEAVKREKEVAQQRLKMYRKDRPPRNLIDKTVLLVDDGLATGSTMRTAIKSAKAEGAAKVVVAVPVAPEDTVRSLKSEVDEIVCAVIPPLFYAVGQFYEEFYPTEDEEVIQLLQKK